MKAAHILLTAALLAAGLVFVLRPAPPAQAADPDPAAETLRPALTVTVVQPLAQRLPVTLPANGDVAAWQEAEIGADVGGLRLTEVRADVGDRVRAGQVLAVFDDETVRTDVARARAAQAEAQAALAEARDNAARARALRDSGALAQQQISAMLSAEQSAEARLQAAQATLAAEELRLRRTRVLAPDDGVISTRTASVGAVAGVGGELFRLLRQGRLEWRAELTAADAPRLRPGMAARVSTADGQAVKGRIRLVAPVVDARTRNALVYVDLPALAAETPVAPAALLPGMFARGEFLLGEQDALTVPQQAVVVRDGFSHVFVVGDGSRVRMLRVHPGARDGDRVAILDGLPADARVVERGGAFLNDGDLVRVVAPPAAATPAP
ncbi:efflux RND transporter periplasmic adaptor subunit [Pseudothauera nasutitermitis]|uniref:Efflux RND transporter periplasmic adaptor subunit n=1 Tax=Pseudothauera nasutitermitis TaxID=2565930 RepID=A0A4S4AU28_9RHOO|nr:efflux RND transporter periplasmic adaptor subunit [Pseudothauera nasutitermitis]THF63016.1 efflux RND transporter periplasmic adaptor subunit [Pseudothauera nasutitermitis]